MQLSFVFFNRARRGRVGYSLPQAAGTAAQTYVVGDTVGGRDGTAFSDLGMLQGLTPPPTITSFGGRAGDVVNQVSLNGTTDVPDKPYGSIHGGSGGQPTPKELKLAAGEFIEYMEVEIADLILRMDGEDVISYQTLVYYIKVITNLGNWGDVGTHVEGRQATPFRPPAGTTRLVGFSGGAGDMFDRIGPIWA